MASITENLKKILAAVYGRDVRQAIHDSILDCHNDIEACKSYTDEHVEEMETKMAGLFPPMSSSPPVRVFSGITRMRIAGITLLWDMTPMEHLIGQVLERVLVG